MGLRALSSQQLRDRIADVAAELFYRDGIHRVGVDRIADVAGVTKRTLYRYFRSKDDLIAASLRRAPRIRFPREGEPLERLIAAFEMLELFLAGSEYRGCPYIIFTAELTDPAHPARRLITGFVAKRRAWFRDRLAEMGVRDPDSLSEEIDVLFEGALASGAKRGDLAAASAAKRTLQRLLASVASNGRAA
jgi:AcrR family transcriptional regulator